MLTRFSISRRVVRAGVILLVGWLALEIVLLQLVAARIGWGATLAFLSIKGGIGLFLIGFMTVRGFSRLHAISQLQPGSSGIRTMFGVVSGVLVTLPGLIPSLVGIALFTPSLQSAVLVRFFGKDRVPRSQNLDLEDDEWREIRSKKSATRPQSRKAPLEAKPPSV